MLVSQGFAVAASRWRTHHICGAEAVVEGGESVRYTESFTQFAGVAKGTRFRANSGAHITSPFLMATRLTGTVVEWNDDRGFGFIRPDNGRTDVFFHVSAFNAHGRPEKGLMVTFSTESMQNRNTRAVDVRIPQTLSPAMEGLLLSLAPVVFFFAALGIYARFFGLSWYLPAGYGVMSAATYLAYHADKAKAQRGAWQTPEKTLHWMSVLCGWPGALVAQWHLRHKNRKLKFQLVFWATVIVNLAIVGYNFLPEWAEPLIAAISESIKGPPSP